MSDSKEDSVVEKWAKVIGAIGAIAAAILFCIGIIAWFYLNSRSGILLDEASQNQPAASAELIIKCSKDKSVKWQTSDKGVFNVCIPIPLDSETQSLLLNPVEITVERKGFKPCPIQRSIRLTDFLFDQPKLIVKLVPDPKGEPGTVRSDDSTPNGETSGDVIHYTEVYRKLCSTYKTKAFQNSMAWDDRGLRRVASLVLSNTGMEMLKEVFYPVRLRLKANEKMARLFLNDSKCESVALALDASWPELSDNTRDLLDYYLFDVLFRSEQRLRNVGTVESNQKARVFRRKEYEYFVANFPLWLDGEDRNSAIVFGAAFCDILDSDNAAPVNLGLIRGKKEIQKHAIRDRQKMLTVYLQGLNSLMSSNAAHVSDSSGCLYWAKQKLGQILESRGPASVLLLQDSTLRDQWFRFKKNQFQNLPVSISVPKYNGHF